MTSAAFECSKSFSRNWSVSFHPDKTMHNCESMRNPTDRLLKLLVASVSVFLLLLSQACGGGSGSSSTTPTPPTPPTPPPTPTIGANVNESLETVTIYVDGTNGSDSNNGSQSAPLQTIDKALAIAAANNGNKVGTRINVNPGIYREKLKIPESVSSLPFTLQASTAGTVVISGADSLPGNTWTPSSYGAQIYTNSSTSSYIYPACAAPDGWPPVPPVALRREMVFVNGFRLDQVMFSNQLQPGTFWADSEITNQIYIWPPAGTNMAEADVEVANAQRSPLLNTYKVNNFVLRGLTVEYDNSCVQGGNIIGQGTNVLVDTDQFLWNNSLGLSVGVTSYNVTVQNSTANHNGQIGFGGNKVKYVLFQNDESSYNSWRGALGAYYQVGYDGSYFFLYHTSDFTNYRAFYNVSSGIHFDTDSAAVQLSGLYSGGNNYEGLSVEASDGPFTVQNSFLCNNSQSAGATFGNAYVDDSKSVTFTGNTLYNGGPEQMYILGNGRAGTNWEQPTVPLVRFNQDFTETNNTFIGTGSQIGFYTYYKNAPSCNVPISNMWQTFDSTFSSQSNSWGSSAAANASYPFFQAAILGKHPVPLATWQSPPPTGVGQDTNSSFVPGASAPAQCALPNPDIPDFWVVLGLPHGATTIVPQAGGPAIQVQMSLFSLAYTGNISLTFDSTQTNGSPVPGLSAAFSASAVALSPANPPVPIPDTLTLTTTSATPDGYYPITVTATDGKSLTRTAMFFLQVGSPVALQMLGNNTIQAGACAIFNIRAVNGSGDISDVLQTTYLSASGTGSGQFYQDSTCTTPVNFTPINPGCPAGIEIPQGDCCSSLSGTGSIWFKDSTVQNLTVTISDEAGVLKPAVTPIQVQ
jgi:hypothetical protein